jgi:signal transduction histidine kinase
VASYGWPIAGALVDPDATFTDYGPPGSESGAKGFGSPDWIVSVDGQSLDGPAPGGRGARWDAALADRLRRGAPTIEARIAHGGTAVVTTLSVVRFAGSSWWLLGAAPLLAGWFFLLVGVASLAPQERTPSRRACGNCSLTFAALAFTILDYHTGRGLAAVFEAALGACPFVLLALAIAVPDAPPWARRRPWLQAALELLAVAGALVMAVSRLVLHQARVQGVAMAVLLAASALVTSVATAVRFVRAEGEGRRRLRTLFLGFVVIPGLAAVVGVLAAIPIVGHLAMRLMAWLMPIWFFMPAAILVAHVKHDLWQGGAILSRWSTQAAVAALGMAVAIAAAMALGDLFEVAFAAALLPAAAGAVLSVVAARLGALALERRLPSLPAGYKHFFQRTSEALAAVRTADAVPGAVASALREAFGDRVRVRASAGSPLPVAGTARGGRRRWAGVPIRVDHAEIGVIEMGLERWQRSLIDGHRRLLGMVAQQAGLAVAFTRSYAELVALRRLQATAWGQARSSLVQTLATEISRQIRAASPLLRVLFRRSGDARARGPIGAAALDRAANEVARLERLVADLARVTMPKIDLRLVPVRAVVDRAAGLVAEALGGRAITVDVGDASMLCDVEGASLLVAHLLGKAIATIAGARGILVTWRAAEAGAELGISHDGSDSLGEAADLFSPWAETQAPDRGLGLAVAQHIAAAHGWSLGVRRAGAETTLAVAIPALAARPRGACPTVTPARPLPPAPAAWNPPCASAEP